MVQLKAISFPNLFFQQTPSRPSPHEKAKTLNYSGILELRHVSDEQKNEMMSIGGGGCSRSREVKKYKCSFAFDEYEAKVVCEWMDRVFAALQNIRDHGLGRHVTIEEYGKATELVRVVLELEECDSNGNSTLTTHKDYIEMGCKKLQELLNFYHSAYIELVDIQKSFPSEYAKRPHLGNSMTHLNKICSVLQQRLNRFKGTLPSSQGRDSFEHTQY